MKISMRFVMLFTAIILSFAIVHPLLAQEITVSGTIQRIGAASVDVSSPTGTTYTFYDIPISSLESQGIFLTIGEEISISAYVVTFKNGTIKNIAYSITADGTTYNWHPKVPKAGTNTVTLSATNEGGQPCHCVCVDSTACYECNCYCR